MSDKLAAKFADRFALSPDSATVSESEPEEISSGAFGYLRGARERAIMLELRFKDGSAIAFSYSLLDRAAFDAAEGIRLRFPGQEVVIAGERLNERSSGAALFEALVRHRVLWIKEASRADLLDTRRVGAIVEAIRLG